jgi:hypothetical protein
MEYQAWLSTLTARLARKGLLVFFESLQSLCFPAGDVCFVSLFVGSIVFLVILLVVLCSLNRVFVWHAEIIPWTLTRVNGWKPLVLPLNTMDACNSDEDGPAFGAQGEPMLLFHFVEPVLL